MRQKGEGDILALAESCCSLSLILVGPGVQAIIGICNEKPLTFKRRKDYNDVYQSWHKDEGIAWGGINHYCFSFFVKFGSSHLNCDHR